MNREECTIGLLYPGEMGASFAALLARGSARIVTTLVGRSEQTRARCAVAGIEVLPSLSEVIARADIIVSMVPPGAAAEVCDDVCKLAHLAKPGVIYLDANSIGPDLARTFCDQVEKRGLSFVDGAINGLAKNLASTCTLFLSGKRASEVAGLLGGAMRVQLLGDQPGRASAMKMLLSGLSKGVCALFVETAMVAQRNGMLDEMIEAYARIYPGVMGIIERMLPTYPQHAARRSDEMKELEQTAETAGVDPCILAAARRVHEQLAAVDFSSADSEVWTVQSIIEHLSTEKVSFEPAGGETISERKIRAGEVREVFAWEKCHGQ